MRMMKQWAVRLRDRRFHSLRTTSISWRRFTNRYVCWNLSSQNCCCERAFICCLDYIHGHHLGLNDRWKGDKHPAYAPLEYGPPLPLHLPSQRFCTVIIFRVSDLYSLHNCIHVVQELGFDLAWFSSLSSKRLCVFGLHGAIYIIICLHPSLYLSVSGAWWIGPWGGWLTTVHRCCDTVGWVIWPIKSSLKWPTMCRVGR